MSESKPSNKKPRLYSYRIRKSPYYEATQRYGCKSYTPYNNMYLPLVYEDLLSDYWALKNDVTLWDVGCERQVEITGPDAYKLMQRLTCRNLNKFQVGQCYYVPMTTESGGILNDPVALRLEENKFWLSVADREVLIWVRGYANGLGYNVTVREPDVSPLAVQGPKSFDLMADLLGDWVRTLKYFYFKETSLNGIPFVLARTGWSKQGGYELFLTDGSRGDELWEIIMQAGKKYNIKPGTPCWIERIESGLLNYWEDVTEHTNPFEVGLEKFVDLEQDVDFIGKAALKKIKADGIKRKLVGLILDGEPLSQTAEFWSIASDSGTVGTVSSAVYSPDIKQNLAYGMVAIDCASVGTKLTVDLGDKVVGATVTALPFIDNKQKYMAGLIK
jgi:glycine cleavage system aminomethyltransferase T